MSTEAVAGVDIGGTKIAVALADTGGRVISLSRFATRIELGPYRILDNAVKEIERMIDETAARLIAVGVGCGGPLDRERGLILSPPNLPNWDEFPVIELLEKRLGVPALLDNDANAAALGEYRFGAGRGLRNMVYITISTGIGGGIIIGGKLLHGINDGAGEVGHITVLPEGPQCGCGARGCMEAICSGTSIARRARERLSAGAQSSLRETGARIDEVTAKAVAEAARDGDPLAVEIWDETIYYLAIGMSNIVNILAPEAVVLGGGVSTAGEQLLEPLRQHVRSRTHMLPPEKISILQAALGGESGIYGALILGQLGIGSDSTSRSEILDHH
jgi:glucokinase